MADLIIETPPSPIYYRAPAASTQPYTSSPETTAALVRTSSFMVDNGGLPLCNNYCSPDTLATRDCRDIITAANAAATENGGWTTKRHHRAATTDVRADSSPELLGLTNSALENVIIPLLAGTFEVAPCSLIAEDMFVVKYSAREDEPLGQRSLPTHRDGSEISFIILLSDPTDFEGGGTSFSAVEPALVVSPSQGGLVSFCGRQEHAGVAITRGVRYILAGFMKSDDNGLMRSDIANLFCDCDGQSCANIRQRLGAGEWGAWAPCAS